jgi:hypothetical protein
MGVPKASRLQVIPHRSGMPGHVDEAVCASPIKGDATITAISSRGAHENHLACEERVIASSFAGEAAEYVCSTDGPFLPQSPDVSGFTRSLCGERSPWLVRTSLSPIQASGAGSGAPSAPVGLATETDYACSSEWVKGTSAAQFGEHGEGWGVPADRILTWIAVRHSL